MELSDAFGHGRMLYTVKTGCAEMPEMPFDDGAKTLYLYIGGSEGNPPEELKELLAYLGDTCPENAVNGTLKELQKMVDTVKEDKGVLLRYMKVFEQEQKIRKESLEEGRKEERANTEREHQRAEIAEARLKLASKILGVKRRHPEWTDQQLADACGCTMEELNSF